MFTEVSLFECAKDLGVNRYLLKEFALDDLKTCIHSIEKGDNWYHPKLEECLAQKTQDFLPELYCKFTAKKRTILTNITNNKSTKQIAEGRFLSEKTIESHRRNIIKKLELPNKKKALLVWALENKGFFSLMD